jgi:vacuolar-type H+-ATPase subunit I/STV1
MGLGSTAKKLQKVVDIADELYAKLNDLKSDLTAMRDRVEETNDRVADLEAQVEHQQALLEAIAEKEGVDLAALDESTDEE